MISNILDTITIILSCFDIRFESVYRRYRDTPLVAKGRNEATELGKTWNNIDKIDWRNLCEKNR